MPAPAGLAALLPPLRLQALDQPDWQALLRPRVGGGSPAFRDDENTVVAAHFIFQWQHGAQFVQVLPTGATGSVPIVNPKPAWGQG